jgi:hypothetical protein
MINKARKAIMIGLFGGAFLTGAVCLGQAQLMPVNAQPPLPAAIGSPARATRLVVHGVRLQGTGDNVDEGSKAVLDNAARFIKENPRATVYLGSNSGNPELTYRRERAAAAYLDIKRTRPIA